MSSLVRKSSVLRCITRAVNGLLPGRIAATRSPPSSIAAIPTVSPAIQSDHLRSRSPFFHMWSVRSRCFASLREDAMRDQFPCPVDGCPHKFDHPNKLRNHYDRAHTDIFKKGGGQYFECRCGARFVKEEDYKRHYNENLCPLKKGESLTAFEKRRMEEEAAKRAEEAAKRAAAAASASELP